MPARKPRKRKIPKKPVKKKVKITKGERSRKVRKFEKKEKTDKQKIENLLKKTKKLLNSYSGYYPLSAEQVRRIKELELEDQHNFKNNIIWSGSQKRIKKEYAPYVYSRIWPHITNEDIARDLHNKLPVKTLKTKLKLTAERLISELEEGLKAHSFYKKSTEKYGDIDSHIGRMESRDLLRNKSRILKEIYKAFQKISSG